MIGAGLAAYKPRRAAGAGGPPPDFWADGMNMYFNQADFDASTSTAKQLGDAAALVSWGITDAGSINGTYFNAAGVMQSKASGTAPRLNYVGGQLDNMLAEPAATNLCPYCTQVGGTGWSVGGVGVTTSFGATSPDGTTTWSNTSFSGGSPDDRLYDAVATVVNGATYVVSLYVFADAPTNVRLGWFDTELRYSSDIAVGTGITRISWSGPASGTALYPYVANRVAGGVNGGLHFWGMQLEVGTAPTTLIRNTGATLLTRSLADIILPAGNLTSFNPLSGTWGVKVASQYLQDARVISRGDAATAWMLMRGAQGYAAYDGTFIPISSSANTAGVDSGGAMTYSSGQARMATDGTAVGSATSWALATPTDHFRIGGVGSARVHGSIKRLSYSAIAADNSQLQAISAGTL